MDAKLDLSLLRHEQQSAGAFRNPLDINKEIEKMEKYLNELIVEWKDQYRSLPDPPGDAWGKIKTLPVLTDLRTGDQKSRFYEQYLLGHREVLRLMRKDIFDPERQDGPSHA